MGAEIALARRKLADLAEKFSAIFHGRVVWLIGAEESPHGRERRARMRGIDANGDRKRLCRVRRQIKPGQQKHPNPNYKLQRCGNYPIARRLAAPYV